MRTCDTSTIYAWRSVSRCMCIENEECVRLIAYTYVRTYIRNTYLVDKEQVLQVHAKVRNGWR